jgi:hypothetical protein
MCLHGNHMLLSTATVRKLVQMPAASSTHLLFEKDEQQAGAVCLGCLAVSSGMHCC